MPVAATRHGSDSLSPRPPHMAGHSEPIMGAAYHTLHHTKYTDNYGARAGSRERASASLQCLQAPRRGQRVDYVRRGPGERCPCDEPHTLPC